MRRCGHLSSRGGRHAIHTTAGSRRSASAASGHVQLPPSGPRPMSRGPAVWPKPALPCIKPLYAPSLMMSEWCGPKAPHECHHPVSAERRRRSWGHPYSNSRHGWWSRRRRPMRKQEQHRHERDNVLELASIRARSGSGAWGAQLLPARSGSGRHVRNRLRLRWGRRKHD